MTCDCISTVAITDNRGSPRFKVAQDKSLKHAPCDGYSTVTFQNGNAGPAGCCDIFKMTQIWNLFLIGPHKLMVFGLHVCFQGLNAMQIRFSHQIRNRLIPIVTWS